MPEPTIIIGSLNDSELKKSIESLVAAVDKGTQKMKSSFDSTIDAMKSKLGELGKVKPDLANAVNAASEKRKNSLKKEEEAVNKLGMSYDKYAQTMNNALRPSTARESFYAFQQGFKAQAAEVAKQIKAAEDALNKAISSRVDEINSKIANAKTKLNELHVQLAKARMDAEKTGNYSTFNASISRVKQQIEYTNKYIDEMTRKAAEIPKLMTSGNMGQNIERLRAERERLLNIMREDVSLQKQSVNTEAGKAITEKTISDEKMRQVQAERDAAQAAKEHLDRVKDIAAEARYHFSRGSSAYDAGTRTTSYIYPENDARAKGLTIEQQIENVLRAEAEAYKLTREEAERRMSIERSTTAEIQKRSKYVAPQTGINESFRKMTANAAGININELKNATTTIADMSKYLRQLQTAYNNLMPNARTSNFGKQLRDEIQFVSQALERLRREANRPININVVKGFSEVTLNDIIYKIQKLNEYKRGLNLFDEKQKSQIREIDNEINRLNKDLNKYTQTTRQEKDMSNALGRSWNYMKNRLAFYFTIGASTQFVKNLIDIRSQYEMNERALGILINSAERGTQIFNELSQMALVSPYTLIELSAAAKQLTAYDIAARDVVDTTRRLADMAAAVGIPIERLTYALGQVKAYGYLNARDARMFSNAGIPLVKQLSDYYTQLEGRMVSVADIYDKIKKKAIDYNTVMTVVTRMTDEGGKFFDFQAKMADTLKVRLANLTLAWNNMLNEIGKETQGMLTFTIDGLKKLFLHWRDLDKIIKEVGAALGIRTAFLLLGAALIKLGFNFGKLNKLMTMNAIFGLRLANVLRTIGAAMKTLLTNPLTWALVGATWFIELANAISNANEATKELNQSLRESAKTSYDELRNYIDSDANISMRENLSKGDINVEEAKKAWEAMREQIELSSRNSEEYVQQLMKIENVSERLRQGFSILESISSVNAALKEIDDTTIKVSQKWSAWWNAWRLPDGLIENIKDYTESVKEYNKYHEKNLNNAREESLWKEQSDDLRKLQEDLKETTDSIDALIERLGFSGDVGKIDEVYSKVIGDIAEKNQLSPDEAFSLQLAVEDARSAAAKRALTIRLADEKAALKVAADENAKTSIQANINALNKELADFDKNNGRGRVLWAEYTNWLKERHISEVREMFRGMTQDEIEKIDFSKGKWAEFANNTANKFAKEHNLATDDVFTLLHNWVMQANKWSIFIPLIISSEGDKSLADTLNELDSQIDTADGIIKRLKRRIAELEAIPFVIRTDEQRKELAKAQKELAEAEAEKDAAEKRGGHGKQEARDEKAAAKAEAKRRRDEERERRKRERADAKARREEESELEKALKNELSLIDKIRSAYKSLTDSGMSHTQAITAATRGYDKTVKQIDSVLGKWGIANFDLSKYAGISNPHDLVALLQSQLDTILASGRAKPAEIKDFEVKIQDLHLDAEKYDLEKIKKGLNSELDKLNDEYELSLELADNPALASVFADMFNIDALGLPQTIDEYMDAAQKKFDDTAKSLNILGDGLDIFKASKEDWYAWGKSVGYTEEQVDEFKSSFNGAIDKVKKWATDTINETQELEYRLGDLNEKILIEEDKKEKIKQSMAVETNELQLHLLELQLQAQEKVIAELKSQALSLMPEYQKVFNSIIEHSESVARKLQKDLMKVYEKAKYDASKKEWTLTDSNGKTYQLSEKEYRSEINKLTKEMQKSMSSFKKIKEAFKPSEEDGVKDYVKGLELISEELKKLSELVNTIGDITAALGLDEEKQEVIGDVANSIAGLGQAVDGYAKIQNGDIIGGATDIISGVWKSVSTWLDNSDKKITREINKSKRAVQELEMAYNNLQHAIESSLGAGEIYARKNALTNKQLQLQEKERQLELEKSRKKKHRDEDAIISLQNEINDLRNEIDTLASDVANTLLGSDIKSAAEDFVSTWVGAWRQGENTMDALGEKFDSMIDTMIAKSLASKVVAQRLQPIYDIIDTITGTETDEQMQEKLKQIKEFIGNGDFARGIDDFLTTLYGYLGIGKGSSNANLSALQQGIQSITEDTAGALEAYMNSVSQQVYYQSDILTQIRDAVVMFNTDVQVATIGQILLQLQASYQVQMTIQNTLDGWSSPNGQSVRVEMI